MVTVYVALVIDNGGTFMAGFAGDDALLAVFPFFVGKHKIFGIVVDVDWEALHQPVEIPEAQFLDKFDVPVVF